MVQTFAFFADDPTTANLWSVSIKMFPHFEMFFFVGVRQVGLVSFVSIIISLKIRCHSYWHMARSKETLCEWYSNITVCLLIYTGVIVSSGLFNLTHPRDQIPVDISLLEAPNTAVVMDHLNSENITAENGTAYFDGPALCSGNTSASVRNAINSVVPIEPVCGICGS